MGEQEAPGGHQQIDQYDAKRNIGREKGQIDIEAGEHDPTRNLKEPIS